MPARNLLCQLRKPSKEKAMQSRRLACALGVALAAAFAAAGQADEQAFIKEAVQGNLAEVQLGELAAQRADNEAVRKFAETLRTDHKAALQRATNIAKSLKIEPPTEPSTEERGFYEGLSQLSGSEFDAAFVAHMISAHEAEIAKYSRNASSNNDAIAAMVADALPKLKAHLASAQALQKGAPGHSQH
jgi:putative membrane protein